MTVSSTSSSRCKVFSFFYLDNSIFSDFHTGLPKFWTSIATWDLVLSPLSLRTETAARNVRSMRFTFYVYSFSTDIRGVLSYADVIGSYIYRRSCNPSHQAKGRRSQLRRPQ